jgi:hypothetical protein
MFMKKIPDLNHGLLRTNAQDAVESGAPLAGAACTCSASIPPCSTVSTAQNLGFAQDYRAEAFPTG